MQTIGVVLLFLVGLSGSKDVWNKKRSLTTFSILQRGGRCKEEYEFVTKKSHSPGSSSKFRLHPLIHTPLEFTLAQDVAGCQGWFILSLKRVAEEPRHINREKDKKSWILCTYSLN